MAIEPLGGPPSPIRPPSAESEVSMPKNLQLELMQKLIKDLEKLFYKLADISYWWYQGTAKRKAKFNKYGAEAGQDLKKLEEMVANYKKEFGQDPPGINSINQLIKTGTDWEYQRNTLKASPGSDLLYNIAKEAEHAAGEANKAFRHAGS